MGHKNKYIPRPDSIAHQIKKGYSSKFAFGESKHQAKEDKTSSGKIFSYKTAKTYIEQMNRFANYCKDTYGEKNVNNMRSYCDSYIQKLKDENKSPYTQKLVVSSFTKFYGDKSTDYLATDRRERQNITRSRNEAVRDKYFNETKNNSLVQFCQSTGLRRRELENLKGSDLRQTSQGTYYLDIRGETTKGGRPREVRIIGDVENVVNKCNQAGNGLVWGKVHSGADIHSYRHDYAYSVYMAYARDVDSLPKEEVWHCKNELNGLNLDKEALLEVSHNLGHNRLEVTINYLSHYF